MNIGVAIGLAAAVAGTAGGAVSAPVEYAQLIIREQIRIRVAPRPRPTPDPSIDWKESKGPKCIEAKLIRGASLVSQNSVDLLLKGNKRLRARMERSCPALDYYQGFYIRPADDGRICADRDYIRSRLGVRCEIDAFRKLEAKRRDTRR